MPVRFGASIPIMTDNYGSIPPPTRSVKQEMRKWVCWDGSVIGSFSQANKFAD